MQRSVRNLCCLLLVIFFTSACCGGVSGPLSAKSGFGFKDIAQEEDIGIFALAPNAETIALSRTGGLFLVSVDGAPERQLSDSAPTALTWSATGGLAAAYFEEGSTRVVFYSSEGSELTESEVEGRITQMQWTPGGELLAHTLSMNRFTFGTNLKAYLLRWDLQREVAKQHLYDTTLKPHTVQTLGDNFFGLLRFELAPLGDEIVYSRLYDPPVIEKSLKFIHRHLETGTERLVYDLPLESGGSLWGHDSETLLMSNGSSSTFLYDPWQKRIIYSWLLPGRNLASSSEADLLYVDGHLYRTGHEIANLASGRAEFSENGMQLLVEGENGFILYDLPDMETQVVRSKEKLEKLLILRGFRSINLVTTDEYLNARKSLQ